MPFTGGLAPMPEATGGGAAGSPVPLLQRVFESLADERGLAFDQTEDSAVGAENMALARAITFDYYYASERAANEMIPNRATVQGNLPRWEVITGANPVPGDSQPTRQNRVGAKLGRYGVLNNIQAIRDALAAELGVLFQDLLLSTPANATTFWPGYGGKRAYVASVAGNLVTINGLTSVPSAAVYANLVLGNTLNPVNAGTFAIKRWVSSTSVVIVNNGGAIAPDYGQGGTLALPTIQWSMPCPAFPWYSSIAHIGVQLNPLAVSGYVNPDGTLNGAFFLKANQVNSILDGFLPADETFNWFIEDPSHGRVGFFLDTPNNLDCQAFAS